MAGPDTTLYLAVTHPPGEFGQITLDEEYVLLGRSTRLLPYDPAISRRHAEIRWESGRHVLRDLGSTHGTFVNGRLCHERLLEHGDHIQLGGVTLRVSRDTVHIHAADYTGSTTDSLTGLLNARTFDARTRDALAAGAPLALIGADLDHFKMFNDVFGHVIGDTLLQRVAWAFSEVLPEDALLARTSGDGFIALVTGVDADAVLPLAQTMRASLRNHMVCYRHDPLYDAIPDAERRPYDQTVRLGGLWIEEPRGWSARRARDEVMSVVEDARRAPHGVIPVVEA